MTASNGGAAAPGDDDVKRRVRFDAEADLRLLQAVVKREPFAADHGTKLKAWDDVADEVYATAAKLRDVPSSRRAVTDRFHHLLLRYEQGTLKLKRWTDTANGEEKAALVVNLFRLITARMADIRNKKAKRATTSGGRSSISSLADLATDARKRSGASSAEVDERDDDEDDDEDDDGGETEDEQNDGTVSASASTEGGAAQGANNAQPSHVVSTRSKHARAKRSHSDAAFHAELLAFKREKLELKRQKLALLQSHHEERMALERQRLALAAQQLEQAKLASGAPPSSSSTVV